MPKSFSRTKKRSSRQQQKQHGLDMQHQHQQQHQDASIPFQRLDSPLISSPINTTPNGNNNNNNNNNGISNFVLLTNNNATHNATNSTNNMNMNTTQQQQCKYNFSQAEDDQEDDESELFPSLNYNESDHHYDNQQHHHHPRPPSQNSIASVIKNSKLIIHEANKVMQQCGVSLGSSNNAHLDVDADAYDEDGGLSNCHDGDEGEEDDDDDNDDDNYHQEELQKFFPTPMEAAITTATTTTTTSSGSFSQSSSFYDIASIPSRVRTTSSNSLPDAAAYQYQQQQKQLPQQENMKQLPFPLSLYSSSTTHMDVKQQYQQQQQVRINNNHAIPLRHSQSVPIKPEPIRHLFMRRSVSTPAAFQIGKGRSAFGKVEGNNHNKQSRRSSHSLNDKDFDKQQRALNPTDLPTPTKRWIAAEQNQQQEQPQNYSTKNEESDIFKGKEEDINVSSTSNDDNSSVHSTQSKVMDFQKQRRMKERRKERRKLVLKKSLSDSMFGMTVEDDPINEKLDEILEKEDYNDGDDDDESKEKGTVSYIVLEPDIDPIIVPVDNVKHVVQESNRFELSTESTEKIVTKPILAKAESPTPVPKPGYHKIVDEESPSPVHHVYSNPPLPYNRRISRTPPSPLGRVATPPSNPNRKSFILKGPTSPCSHDSASYSRTSRSGQSVNTSTQTHSTSISGNMSCNRSVTSSVAEADREVRDANHRELRRREVVDLDESMSIQTSDTTSTNAYLALTSSPAQLREGANITYDRFFGGGCNNSIGPANSQSSNASSFGLGWNNQSQHSSSPGMNGRNRTSVNVRSPITVSSNSMANTNSSSSTGEDPPRVVSCSNKTVPLSSSRSDMPPRSDHHESSLGYSKLGSSKRRSKSRSSSRTSSKSSSSKSKSKRKDAPRLYHKIGSAKVADQSIRTSTPSPCHSFQTSPKTPSTPPSHFGYPTEPVDLPRPQVLRHLPIPNMPPGPKLVLVSPPSDNKSKRKDAFVRASAQSFWPPTSNGHDHRAFQPPVILESVVTPEKKSQN